MSLDLSIAQTVSCEAVVAIAEDAAKAILDVYNSKVCQYLDLLFPAKASALTYLLCRTRIGASR